MSQQTASQEKSVASIPAPTPQGALPDTPAPWQWWGRLVLSIVLCALIIGAAIAFDKWG